MTSKVSADDPIAKILNFWFNVDTETGSQSSARWFEKSNEFDQQIRENFAHDWMFAATGEYTAWEGSAKGCLALVVLLDQFPRNMFRSNAGSFATDGRALRVSKLAIEKGFDLELNPLERSLLYMPLMHSECIEDHELLAIPKFAALAEVDPGKFGSFSKYEEKHLTIIRKYGRYPHRNDILGRASTPDEEDFLKDPGSGF